MQAEDLGAAETILIDYSELAERFLKEFQDEGGSYKYREEIKRMILEERNSIQIDFRDLSSYSYELADYLINRPDEGLKILSKAIKSVVELEDPDYLKKYSEFTARLYNVPFVVKLRELRYSHVGKLLTVEGIVVKATPPREKLVEAVFEHDCGWRGSVIVEGDVVEKPPVCPNCGKSTGLRLVEKESKYKDFQRLVIQERPEEVPSGQLPRSIEVEVYDELVDVARPGDRVSIVGIVKLRREGSGRRVYSPHYTPYIVANNILVSQRVLEEIEITEEDEKKIKSLAADPLIRRKIISSIAPAIYGLWDIKEAIALQLFGGVPRIAPDGTRLRGDIHILLIGDPGTAKSQLLQFVARIAPRAIYTTGRGSTAAGLTAAVVRDKQTGEYFLEAGALVLADGGIACIDEIDKMREEDRVAIHEAMEQQTVSIAKAGIVARLNARTSVLAAGNPKYGRYLSNRPVSENVNLPPTILSRFDLIFVVRDVPDRNRDSALAKHIIHARVSPEEFKPPIDVDLLRKYIAYARKYVKPTRMSPEARKLIADFFNEMRMKSLENPEAPIAITPRQLEALIRLAEASARMSLREEITEEDAITAIRLMKSMLENVGLDVESGQIDVDTIMTGKPKSQREKMLVIEEIIKSISSKEGCAKIKSVISEARNRGLDEKSVEEAIIKMKREGIIYEARAGCYAPA